MPLFLSEEEYQRCAHDASLVAEKADSHIRELHRQLETVKAQADAASITTEQTCALLEQKYISLSSDFSKLESQNSQLSAALEQRISELAEAQAEKHQLHLKAIGKDGEIERLNLEASELRESNRQILKLVENKGTEIAEKNSTIKSYLDKIVNFADAAAQKEARVHDSDAELARCRAACARLSQEKELVEKHNVWLNEELTTKVNTLLELRRTHADFDAEISAKVADVERQFNECSSSLKWNKERVRELELKLQSVQEELCSAKETTAANEERFSAEISTVTKLQELYKESAEEWSKKAGELEGVIKALETHLRQVEDDYKEKLEKERFERKEIEKVASGLKEKLEKCEIENENARKNIESSLLPISALWSDLSAGEIRLGGNEADDRREDSLMLVPKLPIGVSGTALAASLLRDGWSLAKMYEKYQEAVDALRHEQLGRKHSQAILERVLYEIEEKAEVILGERAEHERMVDAYASMNQKLQQSLSEQANFEHTILELKADLRRHKRDYEIAQKDILDLQKQVTVLLKECRDIQLRYGAVAQVYPDVSLTNHTPGMNDESDADKVISERLLTYKDINGLVEQNVQLRSLVRSLSDQHDQRDAELREQFEMELKSHTDEATSKVSAVLERSEEQGRMIESLHSSVAMYKRLYEEELKMRASYPHSIEAIPEGGRKDLMLLFEGSQDATKKVHEKAAERARSLEEDLARCRSEAVSLRLERDKLAMEANFARERLDRFMKEFEHQREEINGVLARNVEFSQLIVDYQRRLRESSDCLNASEELSRKSSIEVSVLKHEKELLLSYERRASDEVRSLSERVHRLQASLDTIQSAEEVREEARAVERRKLEEHLKQVEREWAEAKKELQEERDHVRTLTLDREQTIKNAMRQVAEIGKELAEALRAVSSAETRAAVSEARCSDLEAKVKSSEKRIVEKDSGDHSVFFTNEKAKEEMEKLKEEAQANKDHMLQYKEIAQVNEVALRQIESAHDQFKAEADKLKKSLEAEIFSLRGRVSELESDVILTSTEVASVVSGKEEALSSALEELSKLKEECSEKMSQIAVFEIQISSLKEDLEKEHERWRTAQNNYERQVILQSETIQELTKTSQALALLQDEASKLRKLADAQKSENEVIKATWESEKSLLLESRNEAERKYNEINEQNKILLNRFEALHIKLAEKDRSSAGISPGSTSLDQQAESDLQSVISYLRRSKEIAETEFSLLKQEKLRLKSQLESALKESERAQALLHAERANSRTVMFTDDEFKALQLQVTEVNLLRESNLQLREENKYNFEQCQKFREIAQKAKVETEHLEGTLREKKIEVDAYRKEIEMLKEEIGHSETRITELHERYKNIDVEDFDHLKDDYQQIQARFREKEAEVEEMKKFVSEKQEYISNLEQLLANSRSELTEREKKINDILQVEATLRMDVEKQKKLLSHFKKKVETLTKEKDELSKEKQSISKQLEDARSLGKRPVVETASEQAMREKDTRIQILERTLEREREDMRKEKFRRLKTEKTVLDHMQVVIQEKKKLVDELERHKHARENLVESSGTSAAQLPSETGLDDQTANYLLAVDNFEEAANSALNDGLGARPHPVESSSVVDTSAATTARQVPAQALITHPSMGPTASPPRTKTIEDSEKKFSVSKLNTDARKPGRRLVRPRLEQPQEPKGDIEMLELEGPTTEEGKLGASSHDPEPQSDVALTRPPSARKRVATSSTSELREESFNQQETKSDLAPLPKKSKGSEPPQEATEEQPPLTFENPEILLTMEDLRDAGGDLFYISNEKEVVDAAKDGVDIVKDPTEELKELLDGPGRVELQNESNIITEEFLEKPGETEEVIDGSSEGLEVQDPEQSIVEVENEREEGELEPDATEQQEGSDASIMVMSPEPVEGQHEPIPSVAASSDGTTIFDASNATEVVSPEILNEEKNEAGEVMEEATEGSDKSNDNTDPGAIEIEQTTPRTIFGTGEGSANIPADSTVSKQGSPSPSKQGTTSVVTETEGNDSAGRMVDLKERAKQRSAIRQQGVMSPLVGRGRGRAVGAPRGRGGRGVRGNRGGRGQPPPE